MIHEDIDYHGLCNQGSTCYLNSVLQVLFMTKDFREAVESKTKEEDTVDFMLKRLFTNLNENKTEPKEILSILGIENVDKQCDAAEYFEKILSMVKPEVSKFFKGQLTYITSCFKKHVTSEETGPFWTIPLSIADPLDYYRTYSVKDGFKEFFKSSNISEENQMYCDECQNKSDATIECRMEHYPDILTLLLKRFEFHFPSVDVPYTLQTEEYEYELYAVVNHFGGSTSGHYTAKIKSFQNDDWYDFNDSCVTKLNPQPNSTLTESSQTAYLLVYRKSQENHTNIKSQVSAREGVVTEARAHNETKCG
ncbi:hypothetical protein UPYG_G00238590 [Umbra pygmaea]|uniref:USP domain-containing protein n=1 Tax=Umbra pygmaea TaxID=75934 RepID=A0ABD0WFN5_UMBPY